MARRVHLPLRGDASVCVHRLTKRQIGFFVGQNRIPFEVKLPSAEKAIENHRQLLALAKNVMCGPKRD